jgi:hypothetical protein
MMKVGQHVRFNLGQDIVVYGEVRQLDSPEGGEPDAAMVVEDYAEHRWWGYSDVGHGEMYSVRVEDLTVVYETDNDPED